MSTKGEPKNNCYDPRAPNDKYRGNDSMNTLKGDLQKGLPSSGFFIFHDIESRCSKNSEKKKLTMKLLNLIMYMKQVMTQTLKLKLFIIFPCLLMNFVTFHKILLKIWLINMLSIFC